MSRLLNMAGAVHLGMVCAAAERKSRVARVTEGGIIFGVARSIGDQQGNFARPSDDVRDCYLRVTSTTGFEYFWLVAALMDEIAEGTFVPDYNGSEDD